MPIEPETAPEPEAKPVARRSRPKKETAPKSASQAEEKKTQESKPVEKPAAVQQPAEPIHYAVDPMEAFENQTKQQSKKEFDWSQFDDDEMEETSTPDQVRTVHSNEPAFSGSAGTAASTESAKVTSTSSSKSASTLWP